MTGTEMASLGGKGDAAGSDFRLHRVSTPVGYATVTMEGDRGAWPCITMHDVGVNHVGTFQAMTVCAGPDHPVNRDLCLYHVDLPGHDPSHGASEDSIPNSFDMDDLTGVVGAVLNHFDLKDALAIGVGIGAHALARYVAQAKAKKWRRLCGVVLVSPAVRTPGTYEWGYGKAALTSLSLRGHNHISTSYMLQRLFTSGVSSMFRMESDLERTYRQEIVARDSSVIAKYVAATLGRDSALLGDEMLGGLADALILLVVGDGSTFDGEAMELSAEINRFHAKHGMSRGSKTVVRVAGAGTLVPVQNPESVLKPMWGFLQHLQTYGYCMRTD